MLADDGEHLGRSKVFEARPAEVFVRAALGVLPCREDPPLHRLFESIGPVLLQLVQIVEAADKQQIGDLFDHLQRIRNAAGPESVPNAINLILDVAGDHADFLLKKSVIDSLLLARLKGKSAKRDTDFS